ncbi:MAG: hypothetical protein ACI8WB_001339 [Phenylobacterium sp.]|jgi:hypothetical protein
MAKRNRSTLRNYFRSGAMPSAEHFADLVDSSLNTLEEGFDKTDKEGLKISALADNPRLVSYYRDTGPDKVLWSIGYDKQIDTLLFHNQKQSKPAIQSGEEADEENAGQAALSLSQQGLVGINRNRPSQALDVNGVVKSSGRMGDQTKAVPADGKWHNISVKLEGCQAFEVVAGVGIKRSGRYALVHATAVNTCNPSGLWFNLLGRKNRITCSQSYYNASSDKLKLRWFKAPVEPDTDKNYRPYFLQIRSNTDYGEGLFIRCHMTQLWFDQYMQDSLLAPEFETEPKPKPKQQDGQG